MNKKKISLPMHPDHGFLHSLEEEKEQYPGGHSLIGRTKGLAELRGSEIGLKYKPKLAIFISKNPITYFVNGIFLYKKLEIFFFDKKQIIYLHTGTEQYSKNGK